MDRRPDALVAAFDDKAAVTYLLVWGNSDTSLNPSSRGTTKGQTGCEAGAQSHGSWQTKIARLPKVPDTSQENYFSLGNARRGAGCSPETFRGVSPHALLD